MLSYKYSEKVKEHHKNAMMRRHEDTKTRKFYRSITRSLDIRKSSVGENSQHSTKGNAPVHLSIPLRDT
jgi:hypothetical protein